MMVALELNKVAVRILAYSYQKCCIGTFHWDNFWKTSIFGLNPAELDGEEYLAGAVDPIAQFTAPIAVQTTVLKPS